MITRLNHGNGWKVEAPLTRDDLSILVHEYGKIEKIACSPTTSRRIFGRNLFINMVKIMPRIPENIIYVNPKWNTKEV